MRVFIFIVVFFSTTQDWHTSECFCLAFLGVFIFFEYVGAFIIVNVRIWRFRLTVKYYIERPVNWALFYNCRPKKLGMYTGTSRQKENRMYTGVYGRWACTRARAPERKRAVRQLRALRPKGNRPVTGGHVHGALRWKVNWPAAVGL